MTPTDRGRPVHRRDVKIWAPFRALLARGGLPWGAWCGAACRTGFASGFSAGLLCWRERPPVRHVFYTVGMECVLAVGSLFARGDALRKVVCAVTLPEASCEAAALRGGERGESRR